MEPIWGRGDHCMLPATAVAWLTDDPQPGIVLAEFADVHGRAHQLVGKCAYFSGDLLPTSTYPCPTGVRCTIDAIVEDVATVSTRWLDAHITDAPFTFDVRLDTLRPATAH